MADLSKMIVSFDSGEEVHIEPRTRDLAFAERDFHHDFADGHYMRSAYAQALAALCRMKRAGALSMELPDTIDGLMEIADIEVIFDEDAEGKDSVPAPTTG